MNNQDCDDIKQVVSFKKEKFIVEIRRKKRQNYIENKRFQLINQNGKKVELYDNRDTPTSDKAGKDRANEMLLELVFESNQIAQDKIKSLFDKLQNNLNIHIDLQNLTELLNEIKQLLKEGKKFTQSCSIEDTKRIIELLRYFFSQQELNQSEQIATVLKSLAHILFFMSTTPHLPFTIIVIFFSFQCIKVLLFNSLIISSTQQQSFGQLSLFHNLLSLQDMQLYQTGLSILCNCLASFPEELQHVMESNLFFIFKSVLQIKDCTFQIQFLIFKFFQHYFMDQYNSQRQRECIQLLFEYLPSTEEKRLETDILCVICNALCEYSISQLFIQEVITNPSVTIKLQKLIRIYKKKNKQVTRCVLELLNEILEKEFQTVSIFLESDLVKNLATCCMINDLYIAEKAYYILSNLVADSLEYTQSVSSNRKILGSFMQNLKKNKLGITLEMCYLIRNIVIKIEAIEDINHFMKECALFSLISQIIKNFQYSFEIMKSLIRCLKIIFQYCEYNLEEELKMYCIRQLFSQNIFSVLEFYINSDNDQIRINASYVIDQINLTEQQMFHQSNNIF